NGSVDPGGLALTECFFEYGTTQNYGQKAECDALPPSNSGTYPVTADIAGLQPDGTTYHFRLAAANANGIERTPDSTFATQASVFSEPASSVGETSAVLNGRVFPDALQYTECDFEYGLVSQSGFESSVPCDP